MADKKTHEETELNASQITDDTLLRVSKESVPGNGVWSSFMFRIREFLTFLGSVFVPTLIHPVFSSTVADNGTIMMSTYAYSLEIFHTLQYCRGGVSIPGVTWVLPHDGFLGQKVTIGSVQPMTGLTVIGFGGALIYGDPVTSFGSNGGYATYIRIGGSMATYHWQRIG